MPEIWGFKRMSKGEENYLKRLKLLLVVSASAPAFVFAMAKSLGHGHDNGRLRRGPLSLSSSQAVESSRDKGGDKDSLKLHVYLWKQFISSSSSPTHQTWEAQKVLQAFPRHRAQRPLQSGQAKSASLVLRGRRLPPS